MATTEKECARDALAVSRVRLSEIEAKCRLEEQEKDRLLEEKKELLKRLDAQTQETSKTKDMQALVLLLSRSPE